MNFLKKTIGFLAVLSVIPTAFALTSRLSTAQSSAVGRMPTMAKRVYNSYVNGGSSVSGTITGTTLMENQECIEAYTECITGSEVCGADFEDCTTNVLFHGQMPKCLSILSQCKSTGIDSLFGTSNGNIAVLSKYNSSDVDPKTNEILKYVYPTDGSILGQWIIAASISNKYDPTTCVRRYTQCLNRDEVCGADFELCTGHKEFKKQAVLCESTLARCDSAGLELLFKDKTWTIKKAIPDSSRIGQLITAGADLAAMNSVNTCYKVIDKCFSNACSINPFRCLEGTSLARVTAADTTLGQTAPEIMPLNLSVGTSDMTSKLSGNEVNKFLKTACLDTIGSNKYCYMTFNGKMPNNKELADPYVQEDLFSDALTQRKTYVMSKLQDLMTQFDKNAKSKCAETIRSCAMRTCGEGIGSVCYDTVYNYTGSDEEKTIARSDVRKDIKVGCSAIVNTDPYCQYANATIQDEDDSYSYAYINNDVFDNLFPEYGSTLTGTSSLKKDPIGVIASLNASLATSYNASALAQMKNQCESIAKSCVRSLCGTDYSACYRTRDDIFADLDKRGDNDFYMSMNRVTGVLDYTIVIGMCLDTVKTSPACTEHLKITEARYKKDSDEYKDVWGANASSVRDAWIDAGNYNALARGIPKRDANGEELCTVDNGIVEQPCGTDGKYTNPVYITEDAYYTTEAANTFFRELISDMEREAQSIYQSKLTLQQRTCWDANKNGVQDTYQWVKSKRGNDYDFSGIPDSDIEISNDLFGSFCAVRVSLRSDDPKISAYLNSPNANGVGSKYFAVGDTIGCGSWLTDAQINDIVDRLTDSKDKQTKQNTIKALVPLATSIVTGTGGGVLINKLFNKNNSNTSSSVADVNRSRASCASSAEKIYSAYHTMTLVDGSAPTHPDASDLNSAATNGKVNIADFNNARTAFANCIRSKENTSGKPYSECNTQKIAVETAASDLINTCNTGYEAKKESTADRNTRITASVAGSLATAGATYGITYLAVKAAQSANNDDAKKRTLQTLGSKLKCYVGSEYIGDFGDILESEM